MALVIDANMKLFAERMHITSSRMIRDYGLSTIEEIIEAEAEKGNTRFILIFFCYDISFLYSFTPNFIWRTFIYTIYNYKNFGCYFNIRIHVCRRKAVSINHRYHRLP